MCGSGSRACGCSCCLAFLAFGDPFQKTSAVEVPCPDHKFVAKQNTNFGYQTQNLLIVLTAFDFVIL